MYMIVHEGRPVGECWLQQLNLPDVQQRLRGRDARRIDLSIGEPGLWGRGLGTEAIGALVELGFQDAGTDAIVACHVAEDNPRSRRAFEKNGFVELGPADAAGGSRPSHHLVLTREKWMERS
jgi:RimJ/RimL family protein N-acetyltransferase